MRIWMVGSQLAWVPIAAIVLCGGVGYWIDRKTGRSPTFLIAGLLLGVVAGIYELFRGVAMLEKLQKTNQAKSEKRAQEK